ncbi:hypothetical protein [Entomospira culicis]|uniref:Uncharacterized protein n=1 Tax=Entomospira culicis TaxID=2719989 RepID=A0A968KV35_9SPIO|nr:hypothetical protein [Entomospira culicis]NIZ18477.1 hypothetical protein [Entomospira culicis]NIZ68693.1 hypothetical protein [Entomospira culicis]WDI37292.1 hypothetical protein PVA46_00440 [Entomospira culicis]WDI38921.1 hypothetical protein PVA47_00450 [Entomospira culicis]
MTSKEKATCKRIIQRAIRDIKDHHATAIPGVNIPLDVQSATQMVCELAEVFQMEHLHRAGAQRLLLSTLWQVSRKHPQKYTKKEITRLPILEGFLFWDGEDPAHTLLRESGWAIAKGFALKQKDK